MTGRRPRGCGRWINGLMSLSCWVHARGPAHELPMTQTEDRRTQVTRSTWAQDAYLQGSTNAQPSAVVGLKQESRHFEGMVAVAKANVDRVRFVLNDLDQLAASYNAFGDKAAHDAVMLARKLVTGTLGADK